MLSFAGREAEPKAELKELWLGNGNNEGGEMDFWPEFLASSWGKEFVAGGFGGTAGIIAGYPLDTIRIRQQQSGAGSAYSILRGVVGSEGPRALYRGMAAPLASVTFQVNFFTFPPFTFSFTNSIWLFDSSNLAFRIDQTKDR